MIKFRWAQAVLVALAALVFAVGCGGGGGGGGNGGGNGGQTGTASVELLWPALNRAVNAPSTARSARVALLNPLNNQSVAAQTANRTDINVDEAAYTETVQLQNVPVGTYLLRIQFFNDSNAQGTQVAQATKTVNISAGANDLGDVTVQGSITTVQIDANQSVGVGETEAVTWSASNGDTTVALPEGSASWSIVGGTGTATINNQGVITGVSEGPVTVRVTIDNGDTDLSADQTVNVGSGVFVNVSPTIATVLPSGTRTFTADQTVTWSVQGGDVNGTIDANGVYTAPAGTGTFTIVATSTADPSKTDTATVVVGTALADFMTDFSGGPASSGFNGISGNGNVAVGFGSPGVDNFAARFIRSTGVFDQLSGVGAGQAYAANLDGMVIVGTREPGGSGFTAFSWNSTTGLTDLATLSGWGSTFALGTNAAGDIVVGRAFVNGVSTAVKWINGVPTVLPKFDNIGEAQNETDAIGTNDNGNVIVGQATFNNNGSLGTRPVRWSPSGGGAVFSLGLLTGGTQGRANAVSNQASSADVTIVGESATTVGGTHTEAFRWTQAGGMQGLGDLPGGGLDSRALAVSGDGSVIVGEGSGPDGAEAFIWDSTNGIRSLRTVLEANGLTNYLTGWTLRRATGISRDGKVVVGIAVRADASQQDGFEEAAFVVVLP